MIGIIAVLAGIVLTVVSRGRGVASAVACMANLRQVHAAFTQYLDESGGHYPEPSPESESWEQLLRRHVPSPAVYRCGADPELFPAVGSSYDWRDTGNPETSLAGRQRSDKYRSEAVLAFEALPGWHARQMMTAVRLDGSAASMLADECLADLQRPVKPR